jgi:hypothetical protein
MLYFALMKCSKDWTMIAKDHNKDSMIESAEDWFNVGHDTKVVKYVKGKEIVVTAYIK